MNTQQSLSFGQRLRRERLLRGFTQETLAKHLKVAKLSVTRWENDQAAPHISTQQEIFAFFGKNAENFGRMQQQTWNVPFERNPFFRGRDDMLNALHKALTDGGRIAITQHALSGLGGIGKTQTAVEYAYRFAHEYQAVLWVRSDSPELLAADFAALAPLLNLRDKKATYQLQIIEAVKSWLKAHSGWLLIFDNVEDISLLKDFLPTKREGAVLVTTRDQVRGRYIKKFDVEKLNSEESLLLLLTRAKLIEDETQVLTLTENELEAARQLCEHLDGLPLAIDQAAAYIEENERTLTDYLTLFQQHRSTLLAWSSVNRDYPYSVATTWTLSFEKIEQQYPASADLLCLCAFLHPDAIPQELFLETAAYLSPQLEQAANNAVALDHLIKPLFSFSLVKRDGKTQTLTIHRLVQAVQQDRMEPSVAHLWAERVVRAINAIFPEGDYAQWERCDRYLPHALICATLIREKHLVLPEAATLLQHVGHYLRERARFMEAIPILQLAVHLNEQIFGPEHLNIAAALYYLAGTYRELVQHDKAQPLLERALTIRRQQLGIQHPDTASAIVELAMLFHEQKSYVEAEQHFQWAAELYEQILGPEHPDTLKSLNALAGFYSDHKHFVEAEPLFHRIYTIRTRILGTDHPDTARSLHNLAILYTNQQRYIEAEQNFWLAFATTEKHLGAYHRATATTLHNIASLYKIQRRYEEADTIWRRALTIRKRTLGLEHADTQKIIGHLREMYEEQRKSAEEIALLIAELQAPEVDDEQQEEPIEEQLL